MRLYISPVNGDELISDAYPATPCPEQGALRFTGSYIEVEGGDDENKVMEKKIDIVHYFNLNKLELKKAAFNGWAKKFMPMRRAKLQETNPNLVNKFMDEAKKFVKYILDTFDNTEFYFGQSCDPDDMFVICQFNEEGTPYFYLLESAVDNMKC